MMSLKDKDDKKFDFILLTSFYTFQSVKADKSDRVYMTRITLQNIISPMLNDMKLYFDFYISYISEHKIRENP